MFNPFYIYDFVYLGQPYSSILINLMFIEGTEKKEHKQQ